MDFKVKFIYDVFYCIVVFKRSLARYLPSMSISTIDNLKEQSSQDSDCVFDVGYG